MKAIANARRLALFAAFLLASSSSPTLAVPAGRVSVESAQSVPLAKPTWLKQHARGFDINIRYPRVSNTAKAASINLLLKHFVQQQVTDYRAKSLSTWTKGTPRGRLVGNYQVACSTPQAISIRFKFSTYYPDAATATDEFRCLNFDPETGHALTLAHVFKEGVDYPNILSVLSLHQLVDLGEGTELTSIPDTVKPKAKNFDNFSVTPLNLEIFCRELTEDPDVYDTRRIDLPLARLKDLLSDHLKTIASHGVSFVPSDIPKLEPSLLKTQLAQLSIGSLSVMIAHNPKMPELYELRAKYYKDLDRQEPAEQDLAQAKTLNLNAVLP